MSEPELTIEIETPAYTLEAIRDAVDFYALDYPEMEAPLRLYGAIMEVQRQALEELSPSESLSAEEVEERLRNGEALLEPLTLPIDAAAYRELVEAVARVVDELSPAGLSLTEALAEWEGLADEHFEDTRRAVLSGEPLELDGVLEEHWEIATRILYEALAPYYRQYGSMLTDKIDHSLWQRGACPVCGSPPLIGKFREGDGMWLLECSLCHTLWNVQRARCPFCDMKQGSLDYLYLEGDERHRIQYCDQCHRYIKTVDARGGEGILVLPLEDIVTIELDKAAEGRDLEPPRG